MSHRRHTGAVGAEPIVRSAVWRDGKQIESDFSLERLSDFLAEPDLLVWVDICDPSHELLGQVAEELELDPLAVEDAVSRAERPKAVRYPTHTFMTVYAVRPPDPGSGDLRFTRVSAFVLHRGMVTVRSSPNFDIDELLQRWNDGGLLEYGVGALAHGLLDMVVDGHFEAVQQLDDTIDSLESGLFDDSALSTQVQRATYQARKQLVQLRRVVLPMREVVNAILRHRQNVQAPAELDSSYQNLYDHVLRATEWTESLRDMIATIFETNLSLQDSRLNNVMKKLTSWAAIIAVPTAITGYFGQNVPYPGFGRWWGFLLSISAIVVVATALYWMFKKRGWL